MSIEVLPQEVMKSSVFQSSTKKLQWVVSVQLKGLIWRRAVFMVKFGGKGAGSGVAGILSWG